jgi:hypothetical protein
MAFLIPTTSHYFCIRLGNQEYYTVIVSCQPKWKNWKNGPSSPKLLVYFFFAFDCTLLHASSEEGGGLSKSASCFIFVYESVRKIFTYHNELLRLPERNFELDVQWVLYLQIYILVKRVKQTERRRYLELVTDAQ